MRISKENRISYLCFVEHGLTLHNNKSNVQIFDRTSQCTRTFNVTSIEFICPNEFMSNEIDINGLTPNTLESIERLLVTGKNVVRGPLTTIPLNICRFPRLKVNNENKFYSNLIICIFIEFRFTL